MSAEPAKPIYVAILGTDALLAARKEMRGSVLLLEGDQFDQALKRDIRDWAKRQTLTRLDVASANGEGPVPFGIASESAVVVVYSERLRVRYQRAFGAGKIDEPALEALAGKLEELSR